MGNCLDVPAKPPSKHRKHRNSNFHPEGPWYGVTNRSPSIGPGGMRALSQEYPEFQPMPGYGMHPSMHPMYLQPAVAVDPYTGHTYAYPQPMQHPYYDGGVYTESPYGYYEDELEYKARTKQHRRHKEHSEAPDRNGNTRASNGHMTTVITTHPDASEDRIEYTEIPLQGGRGSSETHDVRQNAQQTPSAEQREADQAVEIEQVNFQAPLQTVPVTSAGSTYVTYLADHDHTHQPAQPESMPAVLNTQREPEPDLLVSRLLEETPETTVPVETSVANFTARSPSFKGPGLQSRHYQPRDVVLSYARCDLDIVQRIKSQIEASGISVWMCDVSLAQGDSDFDNTGMSIIDAKLMVVVLTVNSVQSRHIRDEVSLACVSDTLIYPFAISQTMDLLVSMETALKLQLVPLKWVEQNNAHVPPDIVVDLLVKSLVDELEAIEALNTATNDQADEVRPQAERRHNIPRQRHVLRTISLNTPMTASEYWQKYYPDDSSVDWSIFTRDFNLEFGDRMSNTVPKANHQYVMDCVKREAGVFEGGRIHKSQLLAFCLDEGTAHALWDRTLALARETLAVLDVLDMESTVSMITLENIGRFASDAVIRVLNDLLSHHDANMRAVAAVSLSRCVSCGESTIVNALMRALQDNDRLVREAACLAMGQIRETRAVPRLIHMWRNDVISHVREAAAMALNQIGGSDVEDAMRVTKVLADEIRTLTATD